MESNMDTALSLRQRVLSAPGCEFDCEITADYGNIIYSFLVNCKFDDQGALTFGVIEPKSISGISGVISSQGGSLTFDDEVLAFPLMADGYISPISAPWVFMKALRSGYIHSCSASNNGFCIRLHDSYAENSLEMDVWFDENDIPFHSELLWQGRKILSLNVKNFQWL